MVFSSSATAITTAFDLPAALANPGVIAQTPTGTVGTQPSQIDITFSEPMNQGSFDPTADLAILTGPGNVNLLSQVTGFSWVTSSILRVNFNARSAEGAYSMVLGPNILAADDNSPLNQDGDGTAGEATADRYTAIFRYDALGMQVGSTAPVSGSTLALPFTTLDVNFNEPYAPASVGIDDLELSQGTVTGVTLLDADTVRYTLGGVSDASLTLVLNVKYGAVTDLFGFPIQAYASSFTLPDVVTTQYPATLAAVVPLGSLVYDSHISGAINVIGDTDSFTINLDAGLSVTLVADPGAAAPSVGNQRSGKHRGCHQYVGRSRLGCTYPDNYDHDCRDL